jgi:hypothetical protein
LFPAAILIAAHAFSEFGTLNFSCIHVMKLAKLAFRMSEDIGKP